MPWPCIAIICNGHWRRERHSEVDAPLAHTSIQAEIVGEAVDLAGLDGVTNLRA